MHCISVYLIKKSDLRDSNINYILDSESGGDKIVWTELKEDILATTNILSKEFIKGKMVAKIKTDYFGGMGSQSAKVFEDGEIIMSQDDEFRFGCFPINSALKLLGVVGKNNLDEFDTVGLGDYRDNSQFN